jgi:hypothetical protein
MSQGEEMLDGKEGAVVAGWRRRRPAAAAKKGDR